MGNSSVPSLFSLHRCKTLHLVRHGQGIHNVEGDKNVGALLNSQYLDAHLTELGRQQETCSNYWTFQEDRFNDYISTNEDSSNCGGSFWQGKLFKYDGYATAYGGKCRKEWPAAISSQNCPPIVAVELCREHLGVRPCDKRSNISDYHVLFPEVDFSLVESDEDVLCKVDIREANEELAERGLQFLNWLWTWKEKDGPVSPRGPYEKTQAFSHYHSAHEARPSYLAANPSFIGPT